MLHKGALFCIWGANNSRKCILAVSSVPLALYSASLVTIRPPQMFEVVEEGFSGWQIMAHCVAIGVLINRENMFLGSLVPHYFSTILR